jgi:hypothetical protein
MGDAPQCRGMSNKEQVGQPLTFVRAGRAPDVATAYASSSLCVDISPNASAAAFFSDTSGSCIQDTRSGRTPPSAITCAWAAVWDAKTLNALAAASRTPTSN